MNFGLIGLLGTLQVSNPQIDSLRIPKDSMQFYAQEVAYMLRRSVNRIELGPSGDYDNGNCWCRTEVIREGKEFMMAYVRWHHNEADHGEFQSSHNDWVLELTSKGDGMMVGTIDPNLDGLPLCIIKKGGRQFKFTDEPCGTMYALNLRLAYDILKKEQ